MLQKYTEKTLNKTDRQIDRQTFFTYIYITFCNFKMFLL